MTTVQLFGDIGLYSNYKQIINFTSVSAQNAWFNSKTKKTVTNVIYNKVYNSLKLNMSYGEAIQYSYVRLLDLDNTGRIYYNFVSAVNLIDDATVEFILEPDVIQTYMTYWSLKESMVNRAHVDRWSKTADTPIRITPNNDGINAIYDVESKDIFCNKYRDSPNSEQYAEYNYAIFFAYIVFKADSGIKMYASPFVYCSDPSAPTSAISLVHEDESDANTFLAVSSFANNDVLTYFNIDPESVLSMFVTPFSPFSYTYQQSTHMSTQWVLDFNSVTYVTSTSDLKYDVMDVPIQGGTVKFEPNIFVVDAVKPVKPTDNADASDTFEPALYMAPYRIRNVSTASGSMNIDIPDTALEKDEKISFVQLYGNTSQNVLVLYGEEYDRLYGRAVEPMIDAYNEGSVQAYMMDTIDVFNNAWLTYALTQKDSDRQILNNNAISSVIQGLLFGSYGGALVTSRGTGGTDKRSLAKMATRMGPGIALGGLASAGAALIDSHYAWENQLLEERKIENKAQNISISGNNGVNNIVMGVSFPTFIVLKCDDTNYQRAYDNFRKYGYMINQFTELDINSRKYYNYVMTNGAVIGGAIPENVRDIIASIFDSGVTIFHGDYCDTLTYPTKENIERSLMT